jgi:hypothetical protein
MIAASLPLIPSIAGESGRRWRVTAGASMREGLAPAVSAASSLNSRTSGHDSMPWSWKNVTT